MLRKANIGQMPWTPHMEAGLAHGHVVNVGRELGTRDIGFRIQRLEPGETASRKHRHLHEEEMFLIVSGMGTLIHGEERIPVGPGDAIAYPAGEPEAHTFENTGAAPLVIYAFGQRKDHEVVVMPDSQVAHVAGLKGEVDIDWVRPDPKPPGQGY